tara:strand:- start:868 stop:1521 length:654 start_codon:yes stop_codon:yes gene_type:complete
MLHKSNFFDNIGVLFKKYPTVDLTDLFSKGQMDSKRWLVDMLVELDLPLGVVFICAGWYGSLATFLFESDLKINKIRSFDIDPLCADIADTFNRSWVMNQWEFKAITADIMDIDYQHHTWQIWSNANNRMCRPITDSPDTVINTSCEHIENFAEWYDKIPKGTLVVLQSNNFQEVNEHVNCSIDAESFSISAPMENCLFLGELELEKYTRFMKIGTK